MTTPATPTPQQVEEARRAVLETMAELGQSADEVANSLRRLSIKGRRRHDCDCPLARKFKKVVPGASKVSVGHDRVVVYFRDDSGYSVPTAIVNMMPACSMFVREFDYGVLFADLIDTTPIA